MNNKKDSIMSTEIANQDIETTAKKVKSSEEAMKVVIEMEKLAVINTAFLGLPSNKFKYLKDLNFFDVINMINENIMALKIYQNKNTIQAIAHKNEIIFYNLLCPRNC